MAKIPKHPRIGQRVPTPKTLAAFDALPRRSQATFQNVTHVVTRMREGASLKSAAAEYGSRSAQRRAHRQIRLAQDRERTVRGQAQRSAAARPGGPVHGGRVEVGVRGLSRRPPRSPIARTRNGASSIPATIRNCEHLQDKTILDASGREIPFLTDEDELARLGDLGALSFESIYARRG